MFDMLLFTLEVFAGISCLYMLEILTLLNLNQRLKT